MFQLSNLQKKLTDLGTPAMIELLKSYGPNITAPQRAMLQKLEKPKNNRLDWVSVRFKGRSGTQCFLNRLLSQWVDLACTRPFMFMIS